ncbi:MAG: c-type cytochrome biogenesis protein CcmI [Geminicoccaceae bacterium]|nr:MAG: c-type cytochrome biogenesis protein CcmI [Geminicoccaceae bacterium]
MTAFTIIAALLAVTVAIMVVWPLIRPKAGVEARTQAMAVYRDQLDEVDRDLERGLINAAEAAAARLEVQRRLLSVTRKEGQAAPTALTRPFMAMGVGLVVVAGSLWVYEQVGSPHLPSQPLAQRDTRELEERRLAMQAELAELEVMAAEAPPGDPSFWLALGQLRTELLGPRAGGEAFLQGLQRFPEHAMLRAALGEAFVGQAEGTVTPAARNLFREALERQPGQPLALYYLGLAAAQEGDDWEALELWGQMLWVADAEVGWRPLVEDRFRAAARRVRADADDLLAEGPRYKPERVATAEMTTPLAQTGGVTDDDQRAMIVDMVANLEARLAEAPDDLEGWLRLGRAKMVLGERSAGEAAFARARRVAPADPRVLLAEADALLISGETTMGIPVVTPRIAELFRQAAALDPSDPQPHWYLGLRALQQGEIEQARSAWEQVLARVDPASPDYAAVRAQIDALPTAGDG